jgi:hypothetical protein
MSAPIRLCRRERLLETDGSRMWAIGRCGRRADGEQETQGVVDGLAAQE